MRKPIEEVVGDNVLRLRRAAGWSQIKLSERADVSQRVISNIEQGGGAGSSSIGILTSISAALGVPAFLIMTEGLSTDKKKMDRMARVMGAFSGLSDQAQQRIVDIVEDYRQMSG